MAWHGMAQQRGTGTHTGSADTDTGTGYWPVHIIDMSSPPSHRLIFPAMGRWAGPVLRSIWGQGLSVKITAKQGG
jgi:hypothetical protein